VQEDIDMIFDTLREGEGEMEYVNDVLETYSKSFKVCSETFKKQILEA
jgi:predicted RNA-binding protein (virulence factor B family)